MQKRALGFFLFTFLAFMTVPALAEDIDAKIKRLEQIEARIDAKIRKLEEMEVRLETRLQPVAARSEAVVGPSTDGMRGKPGGIVFASAPGGAAAAREKELLGGQVSFRSGFTLLDGPGSSAFGRGGNKGGFLVGGALDIPLLKDPWFDNPLLGQISLDFTGIDNKTSGILGLSRNGKQNLLKIAVSPKYRIDNLGRVSPWLRNIRPYFIPVGLAFQVNSPPSDAVTYLTVGGTSGAGVEYVLARRFTLGLALSYNYFNRNRNQINVNQFSVGPYVGINF